MDPVARGAPPLEPATCHGRRTRCVRSASDAAGARRRAGRAAAGPTRALPGLGLPVARPDRMSTETSNSAVRDRLLAEHRRLSALISPCEREARRVLDGAADSRHLLACLLQLLDAVESHNQGEEAVLGPILLDTDSYGGVRLGQMIEDHLIENLGLRQALGAAVEAEVPDRAARATLAAIALLRGRIQREERQFLNSRVVKDDIMPIDMSSG